MEFRIETLTPVERLTLINQFAILEKLDKPNAKYHARNREILEQGFASEYQSILGNALMEEMECYKGDLVWKIFQMYAVLQSSFEKLTEKSGLTAAKVAFPGFDGNYETDYMQFARHIYENKQAICKLPKELNCHRPMVPIYRRMVNIYNETMHRRMELDLLTTPLDAEDIWRILLA